MSASAAARPVRLEQRTPTGTPAASIIGAANAANSSGRVSAALSQMVTLVAPASTAARTALFKKSGSARVASRAQNSTSATDFFAVETQAAIHSSIFCGLRCARYSMPTGETGTSTRMRGRAAEESARMAFCRLSSLLPTATESAAVFTKEATVRIRSISARTLAISGSSTASTRSRSKWRAISVFSLKLKALPSRQSVRSAI